MPTAVITGASSGIGTALSNDLEKRGWEVVRLTRFEADLRDAVAVKTLGEAIRNEYKHIDAFVHVAGLWHDGDTLLAGRDLEDFSAEEIFDSMMVGVTSFMILASQLMPILHKDGAVVGVSGTFASGASGWLPYYTAKRALEDFLVGLAQDYPIGPRSYTVSPADTATPAYKKFFPDGAPDAQPVEAVAQVLAELVTNKTPAAHNGEILVVRSSRVSKGFHA